MILATVLLGAFAWSLTEYVLHRFDGHGMKGKTPFSREHLKHHADPSWFSPWYNKAALAVVYTIPILSGLWWAFGPRFAVPFTASYIGSWLAYEWVHRRIHTHAPLGPYGRWVRHHHLQHHHGDPNRNHGVTSPLWDWAFGTWDRRPKVTIPARRAPAWLLDEERRAVRPEWSGVFALRGR